MLVMLFQDSQSKQNLANRTERYLTNFERWATQLHPEDVTLRIYFFITKILYTIGSMAACFLHTTLNNFFLTSNVMTGKSVSAAVVRGGSKAFPYLVEILAKLDFKHDQSMTDKLNNLILNWTPLMRDGNNLITITKAYVKISHRVGDREIMKILTQFCNAFLTSNGRIPGPHAAWAAIVLKNILNETLPTDINRAVTIFSASLNIVVEHIIIVDESNVSRKTLMEMLCDMLNAEHEQNKFQDTLLAVLKVNTKRRLIHYEKLFFNFLRQLTRACPKFMEIFQPHLKDAILDVESMLGVSNDVHLRTSLNSIELMLKTTKGK